MPHYAGIGSRETPEVVLNLMKRIATHLAKKGYTLRSGGAKGADTAFEQGAAGGLKEIFYAKNVPQWCYEKVKNYLQKGAKLEKMRPYVQALLARNMQQLFGRDGDKPVEFVICWTSNGKDHGGTGYAIRAANAAGIPVYNLYNRNEWVAFRAKYLS